MKTRLISFNYMKKNNRISTRLIGYYVLSLLLMAVVNLYFYYSVNLFIGKIDVTFNGNVKLYTLKQSVYEVESILEEYLSSKYSESLDNYYKATDKLRKQINAMDIEEAGGKNAMIMRDVENMIHSLLVETDTSVMARRGRNLEEYTTHYNESIKIYGYINEYIDLLNNTMLQKNINRFTIVSNNFNVAELLNIGIILSVFLFNIILILWFTYKITRPITQLSIAADEITKGKFDFPNVKVESKDEIGVLAEAFNRMKESIRQYVKEITEKSELESKLRERELENLKMKSSLKEAELHALQAQINPHFLFNTLNAGAQLAMFDGADRVGIFIENAAELFRYNLRNMDNPVSLEDEIKNIDNYIYVLKTRFADRLMFHKQIDTDQLNTKIPCMILQPIIENAFIHGIGDMESGGEIWLKVQKQDDHIMISVKDNGKGMTDGRIEQVLHGDDLASDSRHDHKGHTNGIGVRNIINRLELFFGKDNIIEIKSEIGIGTEFILKIPLIQI